MRLIVYGIYGHWMTPTWSPATEDEGEGLLDAVAPHRYHGPSDLVELGTYQPNPEGRLGTVNDDVAERRRDGSTDLSRIPATLDVAETEGSVGRSHELHANAYTRKLAAMTECIGTTRTFGQYRPEIVRQSPNVDVV